MRTPVNLIAGNVSDVDKERISSAVDLLNGDGTFGASIAQRLQVTDINEVADLNAGAVTPATKKTFQIACEMEVDSDLCTSVTYFLHEEWQNFHVSSALNVMYHSPATAGTRIRIVSWTVAVGGRVGSSRCEIWNQDRGVLVASGTHMKMKPAQARL
ncbi:hypothetical protein FRB99_005418 [Tulasnella sp. 403]|nr:hypothetical protein FRB99_005418 [Tulasnella sp. 403]